jgi:hypothetical protein
VTGKREHSQNYQSILNFQLVSVNETLKTIKNNGLFKQWTNSSIISIPPTVSIASEKIFTNNLTVYILAKQHCYAATKMSSSFVTTNKSVNRPPNQLTHNSIVESLLFSLSCRFILKYLTFPVVPIC